MDVAPLSAKIEENARRIAEGYLSEACARVDDIQVSSDAQIDGQQAQTAKDTRQEGDKLEQNLQRLHALESRKSLLQLKRGLLDEGFDAALALLRSLPKERMRQLMLGQLLQAAQGDEQVEAGSINDVFYDADFLKEANREFVKAGRPGQLRDAGQRRAGICGLVLQSPGTQTFCTMETLLQGRREKLEPEVADLLCQNLS